MTAIIPEEAHKKLALYDPIAAGLSSLEEKYRDPPKDLSVPENYEFCRKALAEMRKIRTGTEKLRKELKADAIEYGRKVDASAKGIIDKVKEIEEPYATAKSEYDTKIEIEKREKALAEERRVDGISTRIATIAALATAHISSSSFDIESAIPDLNNDLLMVDEWAMEFADKARSTIADTMQKLEELHALKVTQEQLAAEQAKAEHERAEQAERDRLQREKEAAAERERLEAERQALEEERAAIQAEKDRIAKEQAEKDRVAKEEQAERDRIAAAEQKRLQDEIDALKQAQAKPEAEQPVQPEEDQQGQPAIEPPPSTVQPPTVDPSMAAQHRNETGRALMAITGNKITAKAILDAIIAGTIPHTQYTGAAQ